MPANNFDPSLLTHDQCESIINKIYKNSQVAGKPGCLTWLLSCSSSGYGQMRLRREVHSLFKSKLFNPCHIICSIYHGQILNAPGYEMLHMCHNKKCTNISHLTYEPCTVNQQRKSCNDPAMCQKVCWPRKLSILHFFGEDILKISFSM